jgi:hypothetical protein
MDKQKHTPNISTGRGNIFTEPLPSNDRRDMFFLIPFYLQAIHVHLANGVNLKKRREEEWSVAHLQIQQVQGLVCP